MSLKLAPHTGYGTGAGERGYGTQREVYSVAPPCSRRPYLCGASAPLHKGPIHATRLAASTERTRYSRSLCGDPYFEAVRPISSIPRRASCRICGCGRSGEAPRNAGGSGSWGHTVERGDGAPPSRLLLASGEGTGGRPSACLRIMLCADPSPFSSHLPKPTNKVTSLHLGYHRPLGCPARCCKTGVAARPAIQHAPGGHAELERGAP